jgi:hypothetical protein
MDSCNDDAITHNSVRSPPVLPHSPAQLADQHRTLLDIDVEGQKFDGTKPLPTMALIHDHDLLQLEKV